MALAIKKGAALEDTIVRLLEGKDSGQSEADIEGLDWGGTCAFLRYWDTTSGNQRVSLINAMGSVIRNPKTAPPIIAELVELASALDLMQIEPDIRGISDSISKVSPVKEALANFFGYRGMRRASTSVNGVPPPPIRASVKSTKKNRQKR
jgi:hypothetical protein